MPHGNGERAASALVVVRRLRPRAGGRRAPFFPEKGDLLGLWIGLEEGNGLALTGPDCARLDRLIRDELLELSPPKPAT